MQKNDNKKSFGLLLRTLLLIVSSVKAELAQLTLILLLLAEEVNLSS